MSIHPALVLLAAVRAADGADLDLAAGGRARAPRSAARQSNRLARHLFTLATTAPPGKEVRVTGIGDRLIAERRAAWERWYAPVAAARWGSAAWHTLAWAVFGAGVRRRGRLRRRRCSARRRGDVLLVLAAGARLSAYIGATVGEIGFLRGIWMDGSRRLAWLEDYAASLVAHADLPVPDAAAATGIRLEHVSFAYPGTERLVLDDVSLELPAGAVVAIVGENGAGKTTLVKLLGKLYEPTVGPHPTSTVSRWRACPPTSGATRLAGAFQDFFRFEFRARHTRRRRRRAAPRRRAGGRGRGRPRRRGRRGRAAAGGPRHAARADLAGRRRGLVRPVAEAGAGARLHARPAAAAGARRADRRARRRDRARAVRALRRAPRTTATPRTAASRSWCRTASPPCAWPT